MKLHLPVALLVALVSAAGYSYAETTPTEISVGAGTYSYTTSANGKVEATFTGDGTNGSIGGGYGFKNGSSKPPQPGHIGAVAPGYKASDSSPVGVAASTELTIGGVDDNGKAIETKLNRVVTGVRGYAVTGNKTITVKEGATVGIVIGGYDMSTVYGVKGDANAEWISGCYGTKFAPKSDSSATITINVEGGNVTQILASYTASNLIANEMAAAKKYFKDDPDGLKAYLENPAWAQNEKIDINIKGGSTTCVYGGGFNGAVNNTVEISVEGEGTTVGDIFGGTCGNNGFKGYVKETSVEIKGGTVTGNVCGGGVDSDSYVKEGTHVVLSGGEVEGDVYGAGDGDTVHGGTKVTITGEGTQVGGVISGGGLGSTVSGDRELEVDSTHKGTQDYKLADFKNIDVAGDLSLTELTVATDDDGTSVNVQKDGSIETKAGVLTNLNELNVDGTLNIDMNGADATKDAVSGKVLTMGDNAVINVMLDGAEAANSIALFGFDDTPDDAGEITITLNGKKVDSSLWSFTDGNLVIQEATTATLNLSRNQSRFYNAARAAAAADPDNLALIELTTARDEAAVKAGIDAMSGHEYATAMSSQIEGNLGHLRRLHGAMGKGEMLGKVTDAKMGTTTVSPWRAGVSVFHEETEIDSDARGDGYDRSETGAMLNVEYLTRKDVTLGGAISYGRTNLRTDGAARRHEDNTRFDVYALYGQKRWSFATSLGLGMHEHELLGGDVDGYSINFLQDAAYTVLSNEKSNVQVFGTVESSWNDIDGCSDGVVSAGSQDAWATDVTAGVRYNRALRAFGNAPAGVFTAQTGVTASIGDIKSGVDMNLGGYGYRQESATRNRWGWNLGAGVDVPVRTNVSVYGTAEAVLRGDSNSVDGQIGVKVSF